MHTLFSGGALSRTKRSQLSTMGKKISPSMHPRNFAFGKIVRKNRCGLWCTVTLRRCFYLSSVRWPVMVFKQSQAQSSSLEMASLVALVKCIQNSSWSTCPLSNALVEDVVIVEDLTKWQELVNERDALQWKLDHANVRFHLFFSLFGFVFLLSVYFIIIKNPWFFYFFVLA